MLSFEQYLKEQNAATRTLAANTAARAVAAGIDPQTGQMLPIEPKEQKPELTHVQKSLLIPGNLNRKIAAGIIDPTILGNTVPVPSLGRAVNQTPPAFQKLKSAESPDSALVVGQVKARQAAKERLGGIYGAIGSNIVAGAIGALSTAFERRNARLGRRDSSGDRILGAVDLLGNEKSSKIIGGAVAKTGTLFQRLKGAVSPTNVSTKLTPDQEAERTRARESVLTAQTNETLPVQITKPGSVIRQSDVPTDNVINQKPPMTQSERDAELERRAQLIGNRPGYERTKSAYAALRQRRQQATLGNMNPSARMATLMPNPMMENKNVTTQ